MPSFPLITHCHTNAIFAYLGNNMQVSAASFLAEATAIAHQLPIGRHVLNLCSDRYSFSVTFAACLISDRISLLPSTHTPEMVCQMQAFAPDIFCIRTQDTHPVNLPTFIYPKNPLYSINYPIVQTLNYSQQSDAYPLIRHSANLAHDQQGRLEAAAPLVIPHIDSEQVAVLVFTSGSTGLPVPHIKRWGSLVRNVQSEAQRLGITAQYVLLGTVPSQHMYGLESTVLMPWQTGAALHAGRPLYPADICAAIAELPSPRALVTTPFHLRALLTDQPTPPPVDLLLSATAPLAPELAQDAEQRFNAPLLEIYGCTETGQLASRRTVEGPEWRTFAHVHLRREGQDTWAAGGYIDTPTCLNDTITIVDDEAETTRFLLQGRNSDLVNIAGKRTSLAYLNHHLNAIPGVDDGIFVLPQEDSPHGGIVRLVAIVTAPSLNHAKVIAALRERIDPIFLPRPLLLVDTLPRNATGKIPNEYIQALLRNLSAPATTAPAT